MFNKRKTQTGKKTSRVIESQEEGAASPSIFHPRTFGNTLRGKAPTLRKHATKHSARGSLYARRQSDITGMRGNTRAVLLTGGLEVQKEGYLLMRTDGLVTPWRKKYIVFTQGLIKILDPTIIPLIDHNKPLDDYVEEIMNVVEIRDIIYEKRQQKGFSLVFRQSSNPKKSRDYDSSKTKSATSGLFSFGSHIAPSKTYHFKARLGTDCDNWIQTLLFELKNQAVFVEKGISVLLKNTPEEIDKIDALSRQCVDLWVLAKGKISIDALEAVDRFATFLEDNLSDEAKYWRDAQVTIKELLEHEADVPLEMLTGLEEVQRLNEQEFHIDPKNTGTFRATVKTLRDAIRRQMTDDSKSSLGKLKRTFSSASSTSKGKKTADAKAAAQKHALDLGFKSAVDFKQEKEHDNDLAQLAKINSHIDEKMAQKKMLL